MATVSPDRVDEAIQRWGDTVLPSVQQQQGFKGVRLLVDRKNGRIVSLGLWESEAAFQATVAWNEGQIARFADFFDTPPVVAGYEVVVDV
jgi:heme-degrading monooxygenase HmoA